MPVTPADLARTLRGRAAAERARDRAEQSRCLHAVGAELAALRDALGFGRVWLIGSLAWGGFGVRSDIDLVFESLGKADRVQLADRLGVATGRVVDVLLLGELPRAFQARVLAVGRDVG